MILTAYIDGLDATLSMSREREKKGDVSQLPFLCVFTVLIKFSGFVAGLCSLPAVAVEKGSI